MFGALNAGIRSLVGVSKTATRGCVGDLMTDSGRGSKSGKADGGVKLR